MKTKNYEMFEYMDSNRKINAGLVERLVKSIKEIGYIESRPIIVNEDMVVIDGQHRLEACKRLGIPVIYQVSNVDMSKAMIALNMNQQIWRLSDYIDSYATQGKKCYKYILDFENKYKLGISNSIIICLNDYSHRANDIRIGKEFTINPESNNIAKFIINCKSYFDFYKSQKFAHSVMLLHKYASKSDVNKVFEKIQSLRQLVKTSDYLNYYENIINRYKKNSELKVVLNKN